MKSDGCTKSPDMDFKHCCVEHDAYYEDGSISRLEADNKLFKCILANAKKGNPFSWSHYFKFATTYWLGVRLFGSKSYKK